MAIEFTIIDIEMSQINLGSGHGAVSSKVRFYCNYQH